MTAEITTDVTAALVLGASRGIGHEFVRQLRADGARVIATARDDAGIAALKALGAEAFKLDVADEKSVGKLSLRLVGERFDLALHVAGVYAEGGATEAPADADFDRVLHTNVKGAMRVIPSVAPLVESAFGTFAFVTSGMGSTLAVADSVANMRRALAALTQKDSGAFVNHDGGRYAW